MKFEYLQIEKSQSNAIIDDETLDSLGSEGWELTNVISGQKLYLDGMDYQMSNFYTYIFKREVFDEVFDKDIEKDYTYKEFNDKINKFKKNLIKFKENIKKYE